MDTLCNGDPLTLHYTFTSGYKKKFCSADCAANGDRRECRENRDPLRNGICCKVGTYHELAGDDCYATTGWRKRRIMVDVDVRADLLGFHVTLTKL